jgi:hypothetical protein
MDMWIGLQSDTDLKEGEASRVNWQGSEWPGPGGDGPCKSQVRKAKEECRREWSTTAGSAYRWEVRLAHGSAGGSCERQAVGRTAASKWSLAGGEGGQRLVAYTCNLSYSGGQWRSGGLRFKASLGKYFVKPYLEKTLHKKRTGGVTRCRS